MTIIEALKAEKASITSDHAVMHYNSNNTWLVFGIFDLNLLYTGADEEKAVEALLTGKTVE